VRYETAANAVIDDRELEQLAAEPSRPLFPLFSAAEAMYPLVVVLAFLPALYAVVHSHLTDSGALQGLAGLRILASGEIGAGDAPAEFERLDRQRFQPPLMNWLTAAGLKSLGIGSAAGLAASSYLCTVGLLLAAYALGRRLGGEKLGLMAVLLLAFHPLILEGAQQPTPQSATALFALLTLAGVVTHWQKSSSITSYQLLLAGISLGLCLLAGGPVALVLFGIMATYILVWKIETRWRKTRSGTVWDRSQFSRRTAIRSATVLAATAFALAGWQVLLFSSRFGAEFWMQWLVPAGDRASALIPDGKLSRLSAAWLKINLLAVPIWGLTCVGLFAVLRDVWHGHEDPARRHRLILFPWIVIALGAWVCEGGLNSADDPSLNTWAALLVIPLVMAAALGLIEIAERRVGFTTAVVAGLFTLVDMAIFAGRSPDVPAGDTGLAAGLSRAAIGNSSVITLSALLAGLGIARFASASEPRRRIVLAGLLATIVLSNCWWGASTIRHAAASDREIDDLRAGLSRLSRVGRFTFVAPLRGVRSLPEQPPVRLVYGLASLWPNARFNFADSWEDAISPTGFEPNTAAAGATAYVAWSPRGLIRGTAPDPSLKSAATSFIFQGLEVVVYVRDAGRVTGVDSAVEARISFDSR
jgi:4-amino-4-deoxy-L-arabinose transferase-like glycosyltransferase